MPYNHSWHFRVRNVSLNAPCGALSPTSYGEMEILWLIFFLEIWGGVTPTQLCLLYKALRGFISPTFQIFKLSRLSKSSNFQEDLEVTLALIFVSSFILRFLFSLTNLLSLLFSVSFFIKISFPSP